MEDVTNMEVIRKFVDLAPHNPLASPFGRGGAAAGGDG